MSNRLVSKQEAAKILGCSERTLARYLKEGQLQGAIIGKAWRIKESDLHMFFEEMKEKTARTLLTRRNEEKANGS